MALIEISIQKRFILLDCSARSEIRINRNDDLTLNPGRYLLDTREGITQLEIDERIGVQQSPVGLGFLTSVDGLPVFDGATARAIDGRESIKIRGALTDGELRATAVPVSMASVPSHPVTLASVPTHGVTGPLTNAEMRAAPVETIDAGIVEAITGDAKIGVKGPLTNAELRGAAVPVSLASVPSHPVTLASVPTHGVTGPLTNAEMRAAPVEVRVMSSALVHMAWNNQQQSKVYADVQARLNLNIGQKYVLSVVGGLMSSTTVLAIERINSTTLKFHGQSGNQSVDVTSSGTETISGSLIL